MPRMSTKELKEKYNASGTKQAINRAIRAECPGGPEALDGLEKLHRLVTGGDDAAGVGLSAMQDVVAAMEAVIRSRYDMPPRG